MGKRDSPLIIRMKGYQESTRAVLPRHAYTVVKVSGRAFGHLLKDAVKPFDPRVITAMDAAALRLCHRMTGAVFAFVEHDTITVLASDLKARHDQWCGGDVQAMASLAASIVSAEFARNYPAGEEDMLATFNAIVFPMFDPEEVARYFQWRQRNLMSTSIQMAAAAHLGKQGTNNLDLDSCLDRMEDLGVVYMARYSDRERRGGLVHSVSVVGEDGGIYGRFTRSPAPVLMVRQGFLSEYIPVPEEIAA
jgi:tRNA(His) guanylyltransferase